VSKDDGQPAGYNRVFISWRSSPEESERIKRAVAALLAQARAAETRREFILLAFQADTQIRQLLPEYGPPIARRSPTVPLWDRYEGQHVKPPDTRNPAQILLIVLMWVIVFMGPILIQQSGLSAETEATLDTYYGALAGIAVAIIGAILAKNKKH
jgi:hypothetical protein